MDNQRLALERTVLSYERTWLAWMRFAVTLLICGLAFTKFYPEVSLAVTVLGLIALTYCLKRRRDFENIKKAYLQEDL